jgi:hypothetical protein
MWRLPVDDDAADARRAFAPSVCDLRREQAGTRRSAEALPHTHHKHRRAGGHGVFGGVRGSRDYDGFWGAVLRAFMRGVDAVVG